jgi:pimeloyl-ACP methyl ester carboxylesterase
MKQLPVEGGTLAYREYGSGPPLLLLHAGIADSRMWQPQLEALGRTMRLIMPDLRGFGSSPLPNLAFSHVDDMQALIETLQLAPLPIVGASFGGRVGFELTSAAPDLVSRLVLISPVLRGFIPSGELATFNQVEDHLLEVGDLDAATELNLGMWIDGPHREPGQVDPVLRAKVGEMQRHSFELPEPDNASLRWPEPSGSSHRPPIDTPTLVVVGELDHPQVLAHARMAGIFFKHIRFEVVPATAHLPCSEAPGYFNNLLLSFLSTVPCSD